MSHFDQYFITGFVSKVVINSLESIQIEIDNSIKYVISQRCVDTMIVGFEKVEELDDFAARVRKVPKDIPVQKANG